MLTELQAALSSLKTLSDIIRASKDLANSFEASSALNNANEKIVALSAVALTCYEKAALLAEEVQLLKQEKMKIEQWEAKAQNYELKELTPGVFAYLSKPVAQSGVPRHLACAHCFQQQKLSILQSQRPPAYACPGCGGKIVPIRDGRLVGAADVV